ncbi:hypothetical protein E3J62_08145 [candidate division TA06 bacterium]|uniref:Uncharacterized protein n=1 Tax=candidate division TA06 bacterium TaxID=2250710 RepID=A0A523URM7_UNCT6|nr:MAG: hypothetical protein E3J62_08145 [candidate division TA06 bacterium]
MKQLGRQASGAVRCLRSFAVRTENPIRGEVVFKPGSLTPVHALVLLDYSRNALAIPDGYPRRTKQMIPIHYLTVNDLLSVSNYLGSTPDLLDYLNQRARLPAWATPELASEFDVLAYYLGHKREISPTLSRSDFKGQWALLTGPHRDKLIRRQKEDKYALIVDRAIQEAHNEDTQMEQHIPAELLEDSRLAHGSESYVAIARQLNKLLRVERREIGKEWLMKALLARKTGESHYFGMIGDQGRCAYVFLAASGTREERIKNLWNKLGAAMVTFSLDQGVGVSTCEFSATELCFEFLRLTGVDTNDPVLREASQGTFGPLQYSRVGEFPDDSQLTGLPTDKDVQDALAEFEAEVKAYEIQAKYIAERETKVVHINEPLQRRCAEIDNVDAQKRVLFYTLAAAHNAGYKDCPVCILSQQDV